MPDGPYRIDTKLSTGTTNIEVANDPAAPYHLDLQTSTGRITVAPR